MVKTNIVFKHPANQLDGGAPRVGGVACQQGSGISDGFGVDAKATHVVEERNGGLVSKIDNKNLKFAFEEKKKIL